ncbi:MAG: transposase, partial [Acidimicrobiales bacterium]
AESEQTETPPGEIGLLGIDQTGELATPRGRLGRLQAALAVIEAEEQAAAEQIAEKTQAALKEAEAGRKLRGRKPKDPAAALARAKVDHAVATARSQAKQAQQAAKTAARASLGNPTPAPDSELEHAEQALQAAQQQAQAAPPEPRQVNVTDPDSQIMKTRKGWVQGYNAQAVVNKHQIVVAHAVSQDTNDVELYQPMITTLTDTLTAAHITDPAGLVLADAGYWSEQNATSPGPDRLIATLKDHKQRRAARELGSTTGPPPQDASPLEAMEHRLRTPEGAAAYAQRSHTVEPVFGDRKTNRGWHTFRRRGINAAASEWAFMHLTGNLAKLYQHRRTQPTSPA